MKRLLCVAAAVLVSTGAAQGAEPDPAHLSLVAGYKAAFTCSGVFNAGRSVEAIAGDELHRIYPGYREAMAALPAAKIDRKAKTVSVTYADGFPPRVARWREHLGCAQLPAGAAAGSVPLPSIELKAQNVDKRAAWPAGEAAAPAPSQGGALAGAIAPAFDRATYGEGTETTAVVVVRDGALVAERYREGFDAMTPQRTWSVAKSIAATIIGAAVQDGLIGVEEPAGLAQWAAPGDPRRAITLEHLLHMASGLDSTPAGNRTDDVYFGGGRVIDHAATRRLVSTPGARWVYANNDTMLAMRALRERMDDDDAYWRFPFERVLAPLGMRRTFLETDWNGDFILSSQVWTTARDLARLGQLYLNDGVWDGERLLPEGWAGYVSTPAPAQPPATRASGAPYARYGAQFWLFGEDFGLPAGTYAALGNRGQYVMIVPERNVVIVRRGFDDGGGFDMPAFTAAILAALEE